MQIEVRIFREVFVTKCVCVVCCRDVLALPIFKQEEPQLSPENDAKLPPFQYVLCTATSPAVKLHEETLTYLNQGRVCPTLKEGIFPGNNSRERLYPVLVPYREGAGWGKRGERDGEGDGGKEEYLIFTFMY